MKENKNDFLEDSLVSLRQKASYEAPAGLEAKVMSGIEKKKTPFGLRFASAAVLILAVCVGGLLYRPWEPINRIPGANPIESGPVISQALVESPDGLKKQDSIRDQDDLRKPMEHKGKSVLAQEPDRSAAPRILSEDRVAVRKRSDVAKFSAAAKSSAVANSSGPEDSMAENTMSEDSSEQSFGLGMQDEFDRSESTKLVRRSMGLGQEARGAKKVQRAAAPSAAAEAFSQEDPRDKRRLMESWLESLRQQKYVELERQLREFSVKSKTKSFSRDKKEMFSSNEEILFSNKEMLFSNKEISDWRNMLKNEKYELLEEEWSQKLQQNK